MSSVADLQKQQLTAQQAYNAGKISKADYDAFTANQNSLIAAATAKLQAQQKQQGVTAPTTPVYSAPALSPLPVDVGTSGYLVQGSYVEKGAIIQDAAGKTVGVAGNANNAPILAPGQSYTVIAPPAIIPTPEPARTVEPTLQNILTDPIGVAGTVLKIGSDVGAGMEASKDPNTSVLGKIVGGYTAGYGEIANQGTQVNNVITGQNQPAPFTPKNATQQTVQTGFRIGEAATVAVVAPVVAPVLGVGAAGVVGGEVLNVGIEQGIKAVQGNGLLTLKETADAAAFGGAFGVVGGGVLSGAAKLAPTIAGVAASPVVGAVSRIGINAGVGAAIGAVTSGGKLEGAEQGALLGGAFGAIGEGLGVVGGKIANTSVGQKVAGAVGKVNDDLFGAKFTEITGAKSAEVQVTSGKTTTISEILEPTTNTVTLRGKDIDFYRENNLGTLKNPKIDLAGSETVYTNNPITGSPELEPIPTLRQTETTKSATPIFEALKGNTDYKLAILKTGRSGDFLDTPSDVPALQRTKLGIVTDKGQPNAVLSEKTVVTSKDAILPSTKLSFKDYTGVSIRGEPDAQIYANPAKSLPRDMATDIYTKLGGNYRPIVDYGSQSPKDLSGAMKEGSNDFFRNTKQTSEKAVNDPVFGKSEAKTETTQTKGTTEKTLPRAIVGEVKTSTPIRFAIGAGSLLPSKTTTGTDEETIINSYPKSGLSAPFNPIQTGKSTTQSKQKITTPDVTLPIIVKKTPTSTAPPYIAPIINPINDTPTTPRLTPVIYPINDQRTTPNQTPIVSPITGPILTPTTTTVTTPKQIPKQTPAPIISPYPFPSKPKLPSPVSIFPRGGGNPYGKSRIGRSGAFFERKNSIVTPKDLAGRFVGGRATRQTPRRQTRRTRRLYLF